jgi:predicted Rossmann fold flavoprotein
MVSMRNSIITPIRKDVVIIGAGASGLMCAIEAGKRGRSVLVIDHMEKPGKKIRASGGGRCNFTNIVCGPENYLSGNPHFCKSALARFTPDDFIKMAERHGIEFCEKEKGQLFCKQTANEVTGMLHDECDKSGVEMRLHCKVGGITKAENFFVETSLGVIETNSLVVATGGLSYPELGASDIGHHIARDFGLTVTHLKPGLAPLVFSRKDRQTFGELSGLSFNASVKYGKKTFRGEILFTHKGLSGPAILQISSYWEPGRDIIIDLAPDSDIFELFMSKRRSRVELCNIIAELLPLRFVRQWCELYAASRPLCSYSEKEYKDITNKIHNWIISPAGVEGYSKAEITCGGIDTGELSSKTMEAKKVQGLYFVGEVVDVNGQLGGYNLQWAWSSGFAAGQYV